MPFKLNLMVRLKSEYLLSLKMKVLKFYSILGNFRMIINSRKSDFLIFFMALALMGFLMARRFLIWDAMQGAFIDEIFTVFASKRFLTEWVYSPRSAPIGYEVSVSSGLLSTLPGGLGWLVDGTVFGARATFFCYHLILWTGLLVVYFKTVIRFDFKTTGVALMATVLLTANTLPYIHALSTYILGEWPGVIFLGIGYLVFLKHPRLGSFIFGLVAWHTKFIYLPFAVLPIVFDPFKDKRISLKEIFIRLSFVALPGILLWVLILLITGVDGLSLYFVKQIKGSIIVWDEVTASKSNPNFVKAGNNLFKRLNTLSWSFYSTSEKIKILFLSFSGIILSAYLCFKARAKSNLGYFYFSLSLLLLSFTVWFFFFHSEMWIRHFFPSLAFSFALLLHQLFVFSKGQHQKKVFAFLCILSFLLVAKEVNRKVEWDQYVNTKSYKDRYSTRCHSNNPAGIDWDSFLNLCEK